MKTWLKGGLIGAGIGLIAYILLNLIFLSLGPNYNALVNLDLSENILPCILWILILVVLGAIIGYIIQKVKEGK